MRFKDRILQQFAESAMLVPSSLFGEPATATIKAIANTTFNLDDAMAVYRDMMAKANELRAREKETLARLTVGYQGQPIEPIVTELERMGFKVYMNIDYDPPCSGNAIVLLASEGKLVRFHSVHWGLSNECR